LRTRGPERLPPSSSTARYRRAVPVVTETIQVSGIRCERCVMRLATALEDHEGLEAANANLMGQVTISWDDERTSRTAVLEAMARGGFRELETV
jgi:copper chaperone CopZ